MSLTALLSNKKAAVRTTTFGLDLCLIFHLTLTTCGDKDHEVKAVDVS